MEKFLKVIEAAKYLNILPATVYTLFYRKRLNLTKNKDDKLVISQEELEKYNQERKFRFRRKIFPNGCPTGYLNSREAISKYKLSQNLLQSWGRSKKVRFKRVGKQYIWLENDIKDFCLKYFENKDGFLTISQVAKKYNFSTQGVHYLISKNKLKFKKSKLNIILIQKEEAERYFNIRKQFMAFQNRNSS